MKSRLMIVTFANIMPGVIALVIASALLSAIPNAALASGCRWWESDMVCKFTRTIPLSPQPEAESNSARIKCDWLRNPIKCTL